MARSYAVIWCDGGGPVHAGKLVFGHDTLRLEGSSRRHETSQAIRYKHLGGERFSSVPERLRGLPTLLVEHGDGLRLAIASLEGPGAIRELASQLAGHATLSLA